jgi:multiple sugar transport system permease protein
MSMRESSKKAAKTTGAWLFLAPSLLGVLVFVMIPFGDALRRSFFDSRGIDFVGLGVLANQAFRLAAVNTVRFMGTALPLLMAVSFFLSLLVYQYSRKKSFFKTVLVLPVAVPAASVVLLWRMVFCEQGIINELFGLQTDWIYGPASFSVLIFAYLWKNTGYQMLLWLAALGGISDELYEAAEVDGAGWLQKLLYITIPQVRKAAGMILFLAVINSFKVFREAYIVAGSYPNDRIYLLQHLFNHWFLNLDVQKMCAAAVLLTIVIGIFLIPFVIRAGGDE